MEKINKKKPKKVKNVCSLEWHYRDERHDIGFAIEKYLEATGLKIDDNYSQFSTYEKKPIFYYKNSAIKLTPSDSFHYVSMEIHSSNENKCRKVFEELIKNAEKILINEKTDYSSTFKIPRSSEDIYIPSYENKSCIPYYFIIKIIYH